VRSPHEFKKGHIPGAHNIPLFDDDERAEIGTLYKQQGKDTAILRGLELVGPRMKSLVIAAGNLCGADRKVRVHCWRGGMRSGSLAWLLNTAGFEAQVLQGGYKAYRRLIHERLESGTIRPIVLGGMTGSGKSEVLRKIAEQGEQVVDLEALAHHKGSAFGALGQEEQPSNEQFENDLFAKLGQFDLSRPIWMEDESRNIGKVVLYPALAQLIREAPVLVLNVSQEERVKRLMVEYGDFDPQLLKECCAKIEKRLGSQNYAAACQLIDSGNIHEATRLLLHYYDKSYMYGIKIRDPLKISHCNSDALFDDAEVARIIRLGNDFAAQFHS
jgi:tRNA 2-selenouridine synthase